MNFKFECNEKTMAIVGACGLAVVAYIGVINHMATKEASKRFDETMSAFNKQMEKEWNDIYKLRDTL